MPSPPRTPIHSRNSSIIYTPSGSPQVRRNSKSSAHETEILYRNSLHLHDNLDVSGLGDSNTLRDGHRGTSNNGTSGNGMGNLADELADAFSGSEDEEGYDEYDDETKPQSPDGQRPGSGGQNQKPEQHESPGSNSGSLSLPSVHTRAHQRHKSDYDGSEYGSDADLDLPGMLPSLVAKIDAIESLARRGTENYGGPENDVFKRVTDSLRDLGSQSGVEGSTSRLITAHTALTTHLSHQTRQLHNLTFSILPPLAMPPDAETIDELLPMLLSLSDSTPRPSTSALNSLTALHSITSDLIQTMNYVSDSLHMSRQTTVTASRRLKSAKEVVAEMRRDEELREEGERWLTRGNWGERLENRECAGVCGEVIGGFEEVCNGWRERLLAQAEPRA
ncbi:hypothetical protein S40285_07554 [Stachybotrys chlorohalonatus IBT 40285]|uniref:Uncharacterized protein n=1 Tax=Stachybotrys chlorohalonatus (strain IBT 40285) TaxID=1283841 RepID=A0A084QFP2_STAC4|nr:hypothetical protein S40285_07554 [Stachybotrys chlorohalonata IBT 40285]